MGDSALIDAVTAPEVTVTAVPLPAAFGGIEASAAAAVAGAGERAWPSDAAGSSVLPFPSGGKGHLSRDALPRDTGGVISEERVGARLALLALAHEGGGGVTRRDGEERAVLVAAESAPAEAACVSPIDDGGRLMQPR